MQQVFNNNLGKQHHFLYPQDKAVTYRFPSGGGTLVTDSTVETLVSSFPRISGSFEGVLGSKGANSGYFDINTFSGLTAGLPVIVTQSALPASDKGTLYDEIEMDAIQAAGYVVDSRTIRVHWNCKSPVIGNYKFNYII